MYFLEKLIYAFIFIISYVTHNDLLIISSCKIVSARDVHVVCQLQVTSLFTKIKYQNSGKIYFTLCIDFKYIK